MNFLPHSAQTAILPGVRFSYLPFFGPPPDPEAPPPPSKALPANLNPSSATFFCLFNAASDCALLRLAGVEEPEPEAIGDAMEVEAMGEATID